MLRFLSRVSVEKCANGSPVDPVLDFSTSTELPQPAATFTALRCMCTNFAWKLQFSKCGRVIWGGGGRHCAGGKVLCAFMQPERGTNSERQRESAGERVECASLHCIDFPFVVFITVCVAAPHFVQRTCLSLYAALSCTLSN